MLLLLVPLILMIATAIGMVPRESPEERYQGLVQEGQRKSHDDDLEGALEALEEARQLSPDLGPAELQIGVIRLEQQQFAVAESWARKAIMAMPQSGQAHTLLGLARNQLGNKDGAEEAYRTAIRVEPAYASAHRNLGMLEASRGHHGAAVLHLEQYLMLDPEDADAAEIRALIARLRAL